jgi:hypothetical protein
MTNAFVSVMDKIGHDAKVVFTDVQKYLPAAENLAEVIFPGAAGAVTAINLVESAVVSVEQKFTLAGLTGSGQQKAAEVIAIVGPAVTQLLAAEKITVNTTQVGNIVNAIVGVLNAAPAAA